MMRSDRVFATRVMAESGMVIALATALSLVKFFTAPFGGSVTAGSMIPIILLSMLRGPVVGVTVGVLYGMVQFMLGPWFLTPLQFVLDYPAAFACLGLAGFLWSPGQSEEHSSFHRLLAVAPAVGFAIGGRFLSHFFAGVFFWGHYAPEGTSPWVYSLLYNAGYLVPEFTISAAIAWFLLPSITRIMRGKA